MRWILLLVAEQVFHCASARQAPNGAEVVSACFFAYVLKLDMPGSNHHTIRASDFQRKVTGFYADSGSPPPLLEVSQLGFLFLERLGQMAACRSVFSVALLKKKKEKEKEKEKEKRMMVLLVLLGPLLVLLAYWILALPEHFQEAVLKECPAMVVLAYLVGAESKLFTEPPVATELYNMGTGLLQRLEERTQILIRESWPIDAALDRIKTVHGAIQRGKADSLPSAGLLDVVLAYCKEDLQWLQVALPQWLQGPARLFVYEKCGQAAELELPAHIKVVRQQVVDGPPGGRKDECSAYLTHLSKIVTKDVALYTLFLQADALNHVWPYYLHLLMRAMQLRSLDVAFLHLGQSRMVSSTSQCKRAIFKQVIGREQRQMATGYCCAQFLVRQDLILAQREMWPRALKAMDEPLPAGCEHVRQGAGMHCLVFESIWHSMFGFPEAFTPRAEDVTLPSFLRIPETDESDLPDGVRSTFYLERATGDDMSWMEKVMAKESNDMSGARSLGYVGWDQTASS